MALYLKYVIKNVEPLRFADDSNSQSGQTETLRYIPGTAVRGLVISKLSEREYFGQMKKSLFAPDIHYLNAYISTESEELIPSPKGFYEDKKIVSGKKNIKNVVVDGKFPEGYKRAALGRYCYISSDCIHYYNVDTGSDMKIKINLDKNEKQNVFRNEFISAGHTFTGYIGSENRELLDTIKEIFSGRIMLGNGKSAGLGKCEVLYCDYSDSLPYETYLPQGEVKNECYMMLVSNLLMRDSKGEICGLTGEMLENLEKKMGVKNLRLKYCSTSVVNIRGYNRHWGVKTPSMAAYEQGSVFHLTFDGTLERGKMLDIADHGLGIRLNEGFGRVLFLDNYEKIEYKISEEYYEKNMLPEREKVLTEDDKEVLKSAAGLYYKNVIHRNMEKFIVSQKSEILGKNISSSQLGTIESLLIKNRYSPDDAKKSVDDYLKHADDKEKSNNTQKQHGSVKDVSIFIDQVFQKKLPDILDIPDLDKDYIMGIPIREAVTEEEEDQYRIELIIKMIRYRNKGGF